MCRNIIKFIFYIFCGYLQKEGEIERIQASIKNIQNGNLSEESDELAKLLTENSKLKFRLEILNKVSHKIRQFNLKLTNLVMQSCRQLQKKGKSVAVSYHQA